MPRPLFAALPDRDPFHGRGDSRPLPISRKEDSIPGGEATEELFPSFSVFQGEHHFGSWFPLSEDDSGPGVLKCVPDFYLWVPDPRFPSRTGYVHSPVRMRAFPDWETARAELPELLRLGRRIVESHQPRRKGKEETGKTTGKTTGATPEGKSP